MQVHFNILNHLHLHFDLPGGTQDTKASAVAVVQIAPYSVRWPSMELFPDCCVCLPPRFQEVAEYVAGMARRRGFDATATALDSVPVPKVLECALVVFVVSTTGDGEVPRNMSAFWRFLLRRCARACRRSRHVFLPANRCEQSRVRNPACAIPRARRQPPTYLDR